MYTTITATHSILNLLLYALRCVFTIIFNPIAKHKNLVRRENEFFFNKYNVRVVVPLYNLEQNAIM